MFWVYFTQTLISFRLIKALNSSSVFAILKVNAFETDRTNPFLSWLNRNLDDFFQLWNLLSFEVFLKKFQTWSFSFIFWIQLSLRMTLELFEKLCVFGVQAIFYLRTNNISPSFHFKLMMKSLFIAFFVGIIMQGYFFVGNRRKTSFLVPSGSNFLLSGHLFALKKSTIHWI